MSHEEDEALRRARHGRFFQLCKEGKHHEVRNHLESKTIDPNFSDFDNRTALHIAAKMGHGVIVSLLIDHGARGSYVDTWGRTPLACTESDEVRDLLLKSGGAGLFDPNEMIIVYAGMGKPEKVIECIRRAKNSVLYSNYDGRTALHIACTMGGVNQRRIAEILLRNGADFNAKDIDGNTPLDTATKNGKKSAEALFRAHVAVSHMQVAMLINREELERERSNRNSFVQSEIVRDGGDAYRPLDVKEIEEEENREELERERSNRNSFVQSEIVRDGGDACRPLDLIEEELDRARGYRGGGVLPGRPFLTQRPNQVRGHVRKIFPTTTTTTTATTRQYNTRLA